MSAKAQPGTPVRARRLPTQSNLTQSTLRPEERGVPSSSFSRQGLSLGLLSVVRGTYMPRPLDATGQAAQQGHRACPLGRGQATPNVFPTSPLYSKVNMLIITCFL